MQAEEVAGTVDSISQWETSTKESSQIERLIEAITRSQHVPAQATGTNASLNTSQKQSLQAQIETLTQKLNELKLTVTKSDKVAAYSEPQVGCQVRLKNLLNFWSIWEINQSRITGLAQRQLETRITRERSRDGRPYYYVCCLPGHYQNSCPRRNNHERERPPLPRYALPAPDNYTQYSSGPQPRQRALSPPTHQSRIAAFIDSTPTSSSHPELHIYSPNYDSVDWDYYYGDFNDVTFMESGIIITIMNQNPRLTIMEMTVACVASVSVRFRSRERGTRVKDRAKNGVFIFWHLFHKLRIPFLGLSLLRNQTETLATQAKMTGIKYIGIKCMINQTFRNQFFPL